MLLPKKFLCLAILISVNSIIFTQAQELSYSKVSDLVEERAAGLLQFTDSVLMYESGCLGCFIILEEDQEFQCQLTINLIWNDQGNCKIQKIDCDGIHTFGQLDFDTWEAFTSSAENILNSKFKVKYMWSHFGFEALTLLTKGSKTQIEVRDYYFFDSEPDSTWNRNTPAKIYIDQLGSAIHQWEESVDQNSIKK
ncbi:MAG: hypothetical protein RJQ09_02770 [Cyclobacteriaceae bacterium]